MTKKDLNKSKKLNNVKIDKLTNSKSKKLTKSKDNKSKDIKSKYNKINIFKKLKQHFISIPFSQKIIILLSILIVLLFMIFISLNVGVKVRFLVSDELQINLNPLQKIIHTNQNSEIIPFEISVNNFKFCDAKCNYKIKDTYNDEIILEDEIIFKSNKVKKQEINFTKTIPKFGQQIYYYEIECNNVKTFLCKTEEISKYRSSLITINFNYGNQTKNILENNKDLLLTKQNHILISNNNQNKINFLINQINKTIQNNIIFNKQNYTPTFQISLENYYNQNFNQSLNQLNNLFVNMFEEELFKLKTEINIYNQNINVLNFAYNITPFNNFNEIYDFYNKTNKTIAKELENIFYKKLNNLTTFEDIISIQNISIINQTLNNIYNLYFLDKNIFEENYNLTLNKNYKLLKENNSLIEINYSSLCQYANDINDEIIIYNNNTQNISNFTELSQINLSYCNLTYILFSKKEYQSINSNTSIIDDEQLSSKVIQINNPYLFSCIFNNCEVMPNKNPYPIIFIHGHSFNKDDPPESSISAFYNIRKKLSEDKLIINGGDIDYTSANQFYWANSNIPIGISATYFYITYYDINIFAHSIRKEEGIEVYSLRLKELIDKTLTHTNSDKVIIVSHSMGGLIARNYLKLFGENNVDKLILIAVPNNGVEGNVDRLCSYFGEKKACEDLSKESIFLKRLSTYTPKIPIYNIIGQGCENVGDGVVKVDSAKLPYNLSNNNYQEFFINGTCEDILEVSFHTDILNTKKYPQTYEILKNILFE